jgi:hypothetical protein
MDNTSRGSRAAGQQVKPGQQPKQGENANKKLHPQNNQPDQQNDQAGEHQQQNQ